MIKSVKRLGAAVLSAVMMLTAVATPLCDSLPIVSESVADVASAETYGDYEYSVRDDGTLEITKYTGSAEKLDIPEKINGKSVTSIGDEAFIFCRNLTSITIPNSATEIGYGAFEWCENLTSITIPESVTNIGHYAFGHCTSLKNITIPGSVTSIHTWAFVGCTSLTEIKVATKNANYVSVNGVLYNKDKTLIICYPAGKKDKTYNIIDGVTFIECEAFDYCTNLTSVTIPNSVTNIGGEAFFGCTSLTDITIPHSVTSIGSNPFGRCESLTKINVASENPNYVSVSGVLYNKDKTLIICYPAGKKDKTYNIIDGVTSIDEGTFSGCESLTNVTIPDSVTSIGHSAFNGCTNLTYMIIPDSVTSIGYWVFMGCTNLKRITIPGSLSSIGRMDFYYCTSLTSITIPDNVMYIDDHTFWGCSNLKSIAIPNSVTEIGDSAFYDCWNLMSITIPNSVTYIGDRAFGYYYDNGYKKIDNFKIYCYSGTAGEQYAKDNGFDYELIKVEKPANVTGFKVKSLNSTNVTLQWNKNSAASGYEIEQYKSGKWVNVAKITGNATTSYTVKGLAAGTAGYKFRMRAVRDGAYSDYTSEVTVNTNPYGVGGFKCSSKSSTSVTLKWNKGTTASGYELQQYKDGKWVTIYTGTKATDTSYTVKNLKAGTAGYRFRIRAYKTYGNTKQYGSWSNEVKVNTNPYGVGGFKCSSKSSTSVTLKWNKGTTASGYQLQQYKNGKWVTIYTGTKATNTSYTVKNLKAGTAGYRFRIRAYKTYGNTKQYGSWSSEVKVNTNPYGVGGFKVKSTTKTSITLGWNKGTTASGYQLQQYKGGKWVTVYTGTKATSTSCTIKSLKANTSYKFRIRAYKTYGNTKQYGSWSKGLTVKTKR